MITGKKSIEEKKTKPRKAARRKPVAHDRFKVVNYFDVAELQVVTNKRQGAMEFPIGPEKQTIPPKPFAPLADIRRDLTLKPTTQVS